MTLSDEQLVQIEEMSGALMPPVDIAVLVGIFNPEEQQLFKQICVSWTNDPIYERYQRGRLSTKFELHQKVVKLAKAGSPQAEILANEYLKIQNS